MAQHNDKLKMQAGASGTLPSNTDGSSAANCSKTTTVRATYNGLLREMQFRATRNALMNYHEAENLQTKSTVYLTGANIATLASASGVLTAIVQKGKVLASKAGLAGVIAFPVSMIAQLMGTNTSQFVPNYSERAKQHVKAAANWVGVAETARVERMRIKVDPMRETKDIIAMYDRLVERKADISSQIMISQETHRYFNDNPGMVCDAIKRRQNNCDIFAEFERKELASSSDEDAPVETIYY